MKEAAEQAALAGQLNHTQGKDSTISPKDKTLVIQLLYTKLTTFGKGGMRHGFCPSSADYHKLYKCTLNMTVLFTHATGWGGVKKFNIFSEIQQPQTS